MKTRALSLGVITLSIKTFSIKGIEPNDSINDTQHNNNLPLYWVSLCWVPHFIYCSAECHFDEYCYAVGHCAKSCGHFSQNQEHVKDEEITSNKYFKSLALRSNKSSDILSQSSAFRHLFFSCFPFEKRYLWQSKSTQFQTFLNISYHPQISNTDSCGTTIRCKRAILLYCLLHNFEFKLWTYLSIYLSLYLSIHLSI